MHRRQRAVSLGGRESGLPVRALVLLWCVAGFLLGPPVAAGLFILGLLTGHWLPLTYASIGLIVAFVVAAAALSDSKD